jgi:aryl-alcohol dehydrogenase-like predicted oxidoreductase
MIGTDHQVPVKLGRTSLEVTRIGLGLAALGRPGYINLGHADDLAGSTDVDAMEARAHAVLDAAFVAGIGYFDAARSYGLAEAFLGSWLRERRLTPADVTVGSKWGYTYTAGWRVDAEVHEVKELTLDTLRRQENESRELLGSNLRLYQIHSATIETGVLANRAVLDELARLREGGLAIGISVTGPRQGDTILRALEVGGFDAVQATYNLLEPSAGPALAAAHQEGLGVIVKEAVANGRLTSRGSVQAVVDAASSLEVGADAVALAAVLAHPWVDVALSGAASAEMLHSNLLALSLAVDGDLLERFSGLAEDPEDYWHARAALPWN